MKDCEYRQIPPGTPAAPAASGPPTSVATSATPATLASRPRRKWEVFPGRNRFYCGGRLMLARHSSVFLLTVGLIVVTSGLFFAFDCPFLAHNLTMAIPIIAGILFFFVISCLLQTSFRDPGILPRATPSEAADLEKWIERFDHHCPWVGNCVGKRNYRFFYAFILSLSFLTAFIFACVITHLALRSQGNDFLTVLKTAPASLLELVICFFSVWSIFGLSGFHTYLIASNLTTNEDLKGAWSNKRGSEFANPYSHKSVLTNCCAVLCGPFYPSLIDRRGFIQADAGTPSTPKGEIPSFGTKSDASMYVQGTKDLLRTLCASWQNSRRTQETPVKYLKIQPLPPPVPLNPPGLSDFSIAASFNLSQEK
ncbi:palmitoyltransferase ZDHHC18 isoform X5 [Crotalus tigris]|uniref:palmitoyltransferase ZDHHC18 isoform X5 n=1 Tax=Crotalus tigris TaxID=88082 RepID=UPI00192F4786|nr:palmitoyltransferase ZDHHC18 isoform X5 [Crotalus tigris]